MTIASSTGNYGVSVRHPSAAVDGFKALNNLRLWPDAVSQLDSRTILANLISSETDNCHSVWQSLQVPDIFRVDVHATTPTQLTDEPVHGPASRVMHYPC